MAGTHDPNYQTMAGMNGDQCFGNDKAGGAGGGGGAAPAGAPTPPAAGGMGKLEDIICLT